VLGIAHSVVNWATYKSAQFMKWAENEQRIAQFVRWARVEASSGSGQKFGQFMKWAVSRMGYNNDNCTNQKKIYEWEGG
jgi:hypothetical protein